jgi:hypothetical protein
MTRKEVNKLAFIVLLVAGALVARGAKALAAELVMFERPGCAQGVAHQISGNRTIEFAHRRRAMLCNLDKSAGLASLHYRLF